MTLELFAVVPMALLSLLVIRARAFRPVFLRERCAAPREVAFRVEL